METKKIIVKIVVSTILQKDTQIFTIAASKEVKIVSEEFSSNTKTAIIVPSVVFWLIFSIFSICIAFYEREYAPSWLRNRMTITVFFACLFFNFIGLGVLYLIHVTKEEWRSKKREQKTS